MSVLGGCYRAGAFEKCWGPFCGCPYHKSATIWGLYWCPHILPNSHILGTAQAINSLEREVTNSFRYQYLNPYPTVHEWRQCLRCTLKGCKNLGYSRLLHRVYQVRGPHIRNTPAVMSDDAELSAWTHRFLAGLRRAVYCVYMRNVSNHFSSYCLAETGVGGKSCSYQSEIVPTESLQCHFAWGLLGSH